MSDPDDPYAAPRANVDDGAATSFPPALKIGLGLLTFGVGTIVLDPILQLTAISESLGFGTFLLGIVAVAYGLHRRSGTGEGER